MHTSACKPNASSRAACSAASWIAVNRSIAPACAAWAAVSAPAVAAACAMQHDCVIHIMTKKRMPLAAQCAMSMSNGMGRSAYLHPHKAYLLLGMRASLLRGVGPALCCACHVCCGCCCRLSGRTLRTSFRCISLRRHDGLHSDAAQRQHCAKALDGAQSSSWPACCWPHARLCQNKDDSISNRHGFRSASQSGN